MYLPRKFLLPIPEKQTNVIMNMEIISYQPVWLARYLDFFLLYFKNIVCHFGKIIPLVTRLKFTSLATLDQTNIILLYCVFALPRLS